MRCDRVRLELYSPMYRIVPRAGLKRRFSGAFSLFALQKPFFLFGGFRVLISLDFCRTTRRFLVSPRKVSMFGVYYRDSIGFESHPMSLKIG